MPVVSSFTEEQNCKIKNRKRYARKLRSEFSKDDLDEVFSGSHEDLEHISQELYSLSPARFEALSIKSPQNVPPTPGTALKHKIEKKVWVRS